MADLSWEMSREIWAWVRRREVYHSSCTLATLLWHKAGWEYLFNYFSLVWPNGNTVRAMHYKAKCSPVLRAVTFFIPLEFTGLDKFTNFTNVALVFKTVPQSGPLIQFFLNPPLVPGASRYGVIIWNNIHGLFSIRHLYLLCRSVNFFCHVFLMSALCEAANVERYSLLTFTAPWCGSKTVLLYSWICVSVCVYR